MFSDENDKLYIDNTYKNKYRNYFMKEIKADLDWYGAVNRKLGIKNRIFVNNEKQEIVADRIIDMLPKLKR